MIGELKLWLSKSNDLDLVDAPSDEVMMQLVAGGAQDTWLSLTPSCTFFNTTYRRRINFIFDYDLNTFKRQIDRISWKRTTNRLLPESLNDEIFRSTDFETCLMNGRFVAAISLFVPYIHTREWGKEHENVLIRVIYALLEGQDIEEKERKKELKEKKRNETLSALNQATITNVRRKRLLESIRKSSEKLCTRYLVKQLPGYN